MTRPLAGSMIAVIGDLVEDVAVRLHTTVNVASDTSASIARRRGGSAANVAESVARLHRPVRFIGQVGDDPAGTMLTSVLRASGVDVVARRGGITGTIVVLVDAAGERTMLTDRAACTSLRDPDPSWLDGVGVLHVPLYSLVGEPLATTTRTLVGWAHERGIAVSIDASSAAVIAERGVEATLRELTLLRPDVLLCNELEASTLGGIESLAGIGMRALVVKRGVSPAAVVERGATTDVAVGDVVAGADTTGAGDAFAAGFLVAWMDEPDAVRAARAGHLSARSAITRAP